MVSVKNAKLTHPPFPSSPQCHRLLKQVPSISQTTLQSLNFLMSLIPHDPPSQTTRPASSKPTREELSHSKRRAHTPSSSDPPQLTAAIHIASVSVPAACQRHSFEMEHRYVISLPSPPPSFFTWPIERPNPDVISGQGNVGKFHHAQPRPAPSLTLRLASCLDWSESYRFYCGDMGRVAPWRHNLVRTHSYTHLAHPPDPTALTNRL